LPGKTDKTTGCIILPLPLYPNAHGKKTLCPYRPQARHVLSVFTRSFFADGSGTKPKFRFLMRIKKKRKGLSGLAAGSFALRGGSDRPDLIYSPIVYFSLRCS
jgi:hypothetical protein